MQKNYAIKGMSCASCAHHIEKTLSKTPGIESCEVNFATETAKVVFDAEKVQLATMQAKVQPLGYELIDTKVSHMDHTMMPPEDHSAHLGIHESK